MRLRRQRGTRVPGGRIAIVDDRTGSVGALPAETVPEGDVRTDIDEDVTTDRPWLVIVWNDPINLMSFVTYVLQKLFGYSKEKATKLMLDVHHKGKAVVAAGAREAMEHNVEILHGYGLWATVRHDR